jgi:prevent-host-death family protein
MRQVNIHEAKTQLSALVDSANKGEPFIIAKSGQPMVIVEPYMKPVRKKTKHGFMRGELKIPDDFDSMGQEQIIALFTGSK